MYTAMRDGCANRGKVPTLEEVERMAALIHEEEQAEHTALHKVYILVTALLHVSFSSELTLFMCYCRLTESIPLEIFA